MKRISLAVVLVGLVACSDRDRAPAATKVESQRSALSTSFAAGSLIIPMDTAWQDTGTLRAFGLMDKLLRVSTPVQRIIKPAKAHQDIDFSATTTIRGSAAAASLRDYRSSPFVIDAADATSEVLAIVDAYRTLIPAEPVMVHVATAAFTAEVVRTLVAAPRIGALQTGRQDIIYGYLNAAGLRDANGSPWSDASPGALSLSRLAGPTNGGALDGALMTAGGLPAFDQFTVVHYQPTGGDPSVDEMTRELRGWLSSSNTTHAHLQCSSTLVFENNAAHGHFLSNLGIADVGGATDPVEVLQPLSLYAQYASTLQIDPGDTKSFALNSGSTLWDNASLLVQLQSSTFGQRMNWLTGYVDGLTTKGKISYLGGHSYSTSLPISTNPRTNGVRLFLNGLFETPALFSTMQPALTLTKSAPALTNAATVTFTISYANAGPGVAYAASISDALPTGMTFVSATGSGVHTSGTVKWTLGDLAPGASGTFTVTADPNALAGSYENQAILSYKVGVTPKTFASNKTTTVVDRIAPVTSFTSTPANPSRLTAGSFSFTASETATFQCSLDSAAFTTCSSPFPFSGLAEGDHTFLVLATDAAGNVELTPASFTWRVDLTAPVVTFTAQPPANTKNPTATIDFTVDGATTTECKLNTELVFTSCSATKTYPGLPDGSYVFTVQATDAAGNVTLAVVEWVVDTQKPTLAFTLVPGNPTNLQTATFEFTVNGASSVQCRHGSAPTPFTNCASGETLLNLADGPHLFTVQASDLAGNVETISYTWVVNTVAPTVTIDSGPSGSTTTTSATLAFSVSATVPVVTVECQLKLNNQPSPFTACTSPKSYGPLVDGNYSFTVQATDSANNVGSANRLWVVDTVTPVITLTTVPANPSNLASGEVAFTVSEPATLACNLDSGGFATCTSPFAFGPLTEGTHTVDVRATDAAGNTSTRTYTWMVDLTFPVLAFTSTPPALSKLNSASFAFTVSGASTVECSLDSPTFTACTSPKGLTGLTEGPHTFTVQARDAAGNLTTISHTWVVDTVAPVVTFTAFPPSLSALTTANFAFDVTGASVIACQLDTNGFTTPCPSPDFRSVLADGSHTYTVRASDDAGNTTEVSRTWVVDTLPPDITFTTFPTDPSRLPSALLEFVVTGGATVIECLLDNGAFAACTSPQNLTSLADGPHTFTVRARDAAGNTDSSSYSWTVDTVAPPLAFTAVPGNPTNQTSATHAFTVSDAVTVQCSHDSDPFADCTSPTTLTGLTDGTHTYRVQAVDSAGNVATITHTWVINTIAPTVTITAGPANPTRATDATLVFTTSTVVSVECQLNLGTPTACNSTYTTTGLADGNYTFTVRATDSANNEGSASYLWVVDTAAPVITFTATPPALSGSTTASASFSVNEPGTIECSLNGGTFGPCSSPEVRSGLGEGAQTLTVRVTDPAGNVGLGTTSWNVDTLAPIITLTSTPASLINVATATFAFTLNEAATVECQLNTGAFAACASPYVLPTLADGSYALTLRATDPTGNVGTASFAWRVDTLNPVVTFTTTPPPLSNTAAASVPFTVNEPATTECALNGGAFVACTSPRVLSGLSEGAQSLVVRATDTAGNVGSSTATWSVDTVAPVITFTAQPASLVNLATASFTFTTSESATLECRLDSGAFTTCTSPRALTALADGSHTFTVRATDPTANVGTASVTWTVDTVAPVLAFTSTPPAVTNSTSASLAFTVTGNATSIECKLDSGAFAACTSPSALTGLLDGNHTFTVRGTDAATNAASISHTWLVDAQPPNTSFAALPAALVKSNTATFDLVSSEAGSTFECSLDGSTFGACGDPLVLSPLADGLHVLLVRAIDVAGNADPSPVLATWTVDTLAPDAPRFLEPVAGATTGAFPRFGGTAEPGTTVTVNRGGQPMCTALVAADGTWSCTSTQPFGIGPQTVTATATDPAGNSSPPSLPRTFSVDNTPPDTRIVSGPAGLVASTQADFTVEASQSGATFECSLDGAAFAACSASPSFTGLTQGAHHLEVRAVVATVRDSSPASRNWTVDTVAPGAPVLTAPTANATTSATPVFTGTAEPGSTVVVSLDGQVVCTATATASGAFSCAAPTALSPGTHTVTATATDPAGNTSVPSASLPFTVDGTALDTAIIAGPSGTVRRTTADFAFTATLLGSTFQCSLDGASFAACVTPTSFTGLTAGSHTLEVRAVNASITDSTPASRTWIIDLTVPVAPVVVTPANNSTVYTRTPRYSGTAEPLSTVRVSVDDAVACTAVADASGDWECTSATELGSGAHRVAAVSLDAAGNVSAGSMVNVFTVEIPAVTVRITSPITNTLTNDATPTISGTASPNATVTVFVDGLQVGTTTADATGAWSLTPTTALADGARVVTAQAEFMGYQSPRSEPVTVRIDTTPPVVSLTITQADQSTVPTITFSADETPVTFTCSLDGAAFTPCQSPLDATPFGDGNHTLVVQATDAAGNVGSATQGYVLAAPLEPAVEQLSIRGGGCGCGATEGGGTLFVFFALLLAALSRRRLRRVTAPAALSLALLGSVASAQVAGFDLERLDLNPGASASLINQTGDLMKQGSWRASVTLHYQHDSLLLYRTGTSDRLGAIVGSRFTTHLAGAWSPLDWLEVGVQLPIVLWQGGDDLTAWNVAAPAPTALGTPWLSARFGLLRERSGAPIDLSLQLGLGLPLGSAAAFSNATPVSFAPRIGLGRTLLPWLRVGGEFGVLVRGVPTAGAPNVTQTGVGSSFSWGLSATTLGESLRGELTLRGGLGFDAAQGGTELLLGARYPLAKMFEVYAIGGPGFGPLPGTPAFRVLLGVAIQPPVEPAQVARPLCDATVSPEALRRDCGELDADGDGVLNATDRCPRVAGVASREGCPVPDTDGDGLNDDEDRCPTEKGLLEKKGCPVRDQDKDGVEDEVDACPAEPGTAERKGCPVRDQDKDGVEDEVDACPAEPGTAERKGCPVRDQDADGVEDGVDNCPAEKGVPENAGCPAKKRQLVIITADKLQILEKVFFATGKSEVLAKSFPLLDNIATVLASHPELAHVRIEGHTDSVGVREKNLKLSQGRADAVKAYLVKKKIAADRLNAVGFGPDKPQAPNDTPAGREQNRRVEFNLEAPAKE